MKTKTITLTEFARRVEIGRGEVGQWKHPERVDGFVVERGRLRVDMEAFDRAYAIRPEKRAIRARGR
jgi:hypothetical protein